MSGYRLRPEPAATRLATGDSLAQNLEPRPGAGASRRARR